MGNAIIYSNNNKKKNDNYNYNNQWQSEGSLDRYAIVRYFIEAGFNVEMFNRKNVVKCIIYFYYPLIPPSLSIRWYVNNSIGSGLCRVI